MYKKENNQPIQDFRFTIYQHIPDVTKKYFFPEAEWKTSLSAYNIMPYIPVRVLSLQENALYTKPYPYTESPMYQSPFFILFKSDKMCLPNYLGFVDFLKSNAKTCILSMLNYNTDSDMFYPKFSVGINLPESSSLVLSSVLEFVLVDSHQKIVAIEDKSQLFISIKVCKT